MSIARNWCFTINNFSSDDLERLDQLSATIGEDIKYLVYGRETGENGTPHLQGYIQFSKKKRLGQVRNQISERGHFEVSQGTPLQAAQYCKKDGEFNEFGTLQRQGSVDYTFQRIIMAQ